MITNSIISVPLGIKIQFIEGVKIYFPPSNRVFHLKVTALDKNSVVYDDDIKCKLNEPVYFATRQTYFIYWEIQIQQDGKNVYLGRCDVTGRPVCVNMLLGAMGDMVAWFPSVAKFQYIYNPVLTVMMKREYIELFESAYPNIKFIDETQFDPAHFYASYPVGVWGYGNLDSNPTDFQKDNLLEHSDRILNVPSDKKPPLLAPATRDCAAEYGNYVCISTRASKMMKQWACPDGWKKVVDYLKNLGYRVFCIDADNAAMPDNAEDMTGMLPLRQRIDVIRGCKFFIGLASGLSWIAWACEKPVVMIANFTEAWCEFDNPYRVDNVNVCHGCFHTEDMRFNDFDKCPRNKDFECTKSITPEMVIEKIDKVIADSKTASDKKASKAKAN